MSITEVTQAVPTGIWTLDPIHSSIGFEVAYMGGSFRGDFHDVDARLVSEAGGAHLEGAARVGSVNVKDENLEAHLQSPDFFDVQRHPELRFKSEEITRSGDEITVRGDITIKGVSRPVELTGSISGPLTDPYGRDRIVLRLETAVDRTDFGVNWNNPLPTGEPSLANEVKLASDLYFVREA